MLKRLFDIIFSFIGLLLLLPFILIVALMVAIESRGGVFFKQKRVGRNNREFNLYKIRTMYKDSEKHGLITVGKRNHQITKVGYFLRKLKFDEFPQMFNILKGDMSFVGPRPEVRKYVEMYTPQQLKVLQLRPGLTDPASLKYYDESEQLSKYDDPEKAYVEIIMPHKLALNLEYIEKRNFFYDLKIILKTVFRWIR